MRVDRFTALAGVAPLWPAQPAPSQVAVERRFPRGNGAGAIFDEFGELPGELAHLLLGLRLAMLVNERVERGIGGLGDVIRVGDNFALAVLADFEGVVAVIVIPKARIRRLGTETGKAELVVLLVELLVHLRGVETLDIDLQPGLLGLLFESQHDGRDRSGVEGGEREGELFARSVHENAVGSGFGESGLREVLAGPFGIKRPGA